MPTAMVTLQARELRPFLADLFCAAGLTADDGHFCADCLVQTSLRGKDSHGVMRASHYIRRLLSGAVNPAPTIRVADGTAALRVLDGDNGLGFIVGRAAMSGAMDLARTHAVGIVGVRGSSHFGAASIYARLAADAGMAGIAMSNTVAKLVAPGGTGAIAGSNPIAIAVPSHGDFPFVLDISMSAIAGGKLLLAAQKGERIEPGLATDSTGRPTEDPAEAFAGLWLPMAGVKGLGLSYAIDILSGVITGASFGLAMKSQYSDASEASGTGHLMVAIDLGAILSPDELRERMREFMSSIKAAPVAEGAPPLLVPGERAYRMERERNVTGIPVPLEAFEALCTLADELGVETTPLSREWHQE